MAIPGSGVITAQMINLELARSRTAQLSIDTAENGGYGAINTSSPSRPNSANPAAYSEWYGYDHTAGGGGLYEYTLGYDLNTGNQACNRFYFGEVGLYWGQELDFANTVGLFANIDGTVFANTGWYSNGLVNRRWVTGRTNGFDLEEACII
jgi:hypothetical protein